jgi:hypothetical protein
VIVKDQYFFPSLFKGGRRKVEKGFKKCDVINREKNSLKRR